MAPSRLAYLRDAIKRALTDPALIAEGERLGYFVDFADDRKALAILRDVVVNLTPEQKSRVKTLVSAE